jgi:phosphoglycerate dehydrogenase-like enzyme
MSKLSKKLTVIGNIFQTSTFNSLIKSYFSVEFFPSRLSETEIIDIIKDTNICIIGGSTKLTESIIQSATALELICFAGTQYETSLEQSLVDKYNIPIVNTPGINACAVSEHAIALTLDVFKKISYQNYYAKKGIEKKENVQEIRNAKIGIIGFGNIAQKVGSSLHCGFNAKVYYWSRTRKPEKEMELNIIYWEFDEIISESDVIILAIPETSETRGIIGITQFEKMKNSTVLINIARPHLVDPKALHYALSNNLIRASAFDGYYIKPLCSIKEDPYGLLSLSDDKFVITPHTAGQTEQALENVDKELFRKILLFYGLSLPNPMPVVV